MTITNEEAKCLMERALVRGWAWTPRELIKWGRKCGLVSGPEPQEHDRAFNWRQENPEQMKAYAHTYYLANREKCLARARARYQKQKENQ